ncbi:MAG: hypothetical protein ACI815_002198, partial [Psychroserpens sp.]
MILIIIRKPMRTLLTFCYFLLCLLAVSC